MSYVAIAAQLKTLMQTISEINVVYDYEEKQLNKFPAATITSSSHQNAFNDLGGNRRNYSHVIRLYVRAEDEAAAERVMRIIVDRVIAVIESNISLGGSCDYATPTEGRWAYEYREFPVRICEITVDAHKRVLR